MPDEPLHYLTIREVGERLRRREVSPVELTSAILDRAERLDGPLNAFITITREQALAQARLAEQAILAGHDLGPLHGIPISLKDLYQTVGVKTTGGSKILADWVPTTDATVTRQLQLAGAIVDRQEQPPRVRVRRHQREPALRPGSQPVEPRADHRRIERRLGGGGGGRPRVRLDGLRHGRLDPAAGRASAASSGSSRRTGW